MDNLDRLEKKVTNKVKLNETETADFLMDAMKVDSRDTDKIIDEVQRNYRLISNTNRREENRLQYIEDKVNIILNLLKYKEIDTDELKRLQEIKELEQKLNKLKGES